MRSFKCLDLCNSGLKISFIYTGKHAVHLEGRIVRLEGTDVVVGVSLWDCDVIANRYDSNTDTLYLFYQPPKPCLHHN